MAGISDCCGLAQYVDGITILCNQANGKLYSPEPVAACVTTDYVRGTGAGVGVIDYPGFTLSGIGTPLGALVPLTSVNITNPFPCAKRIKITGVNANLALHVTNSPSGTYTAHSLSFGVECSLDGGATYLALHEVISLYDPALTPFSHAAKNTYNRSHLATIGAGASITPLWRATYSNLGGAAQADRVLMTLFDFEWEIF